MGLKGLLLQLHPLGLLLHLDSDSHSFRGKKPQAILNKIIYSVLYCISLHASQYAVFLQNYACLLLPNHTISLSLSLISFKTHLNLGRDKFPDNLRWYHDAKPQLFLQCTLRPKGSLQHKSENKKLTLIFSSAFEQISLNQNAIIQRRNQRIGVQCFAILQAAVTVTSPPCVLDGLKTRWARRH